jgi:C4-dicarboxylate transporter DctQ subunit
MKQIFSLIGKIIGLVNQSIAAFGISAGVALAFYNVAARYVFDSSLTWASELTIYLFLWSVFFGAAYCFKEDAHISISILLDILPPPVAKTMMLLSHGITFIYLSAVSFYGYQYLQFVVELDEMSIDLEIPMWIPYLVLPIAFAFAAYRVGEKFIEIWKTPAEEVVRMSEGEMVLAEMEASTPEEVLDEVRKRSTGGVL